MANVVQSNNEQAVAFAQQMLARKKATEKKMVEEYQSNADAQAAIAVLREALREEKRKKDASLSL